MVGSSLRKYCPAFLLFGTKILHIYQDLLCAVHIFFLILTKFIFKNSNDIILFYVAAYGQIRCRTRFQQRMQMIKQNIIVYIFSRLFRCITTHETVIIIIIKRSVIR